MSEPYIPSDEELRDRVETVAVPRSQHYTYKLHVANILKPGKGVVPLCGRRDQSGNGWALKTPAMFPAHKWCKPCTLRLFNDGEEPPRGVMEDVTGDAYE